MKLLSFLVYGALVGVLLAQEFIQEEDDVTISSTKLTNEPVTIEPTTEEPLESTTTEAPLDREVSFRVDCTSGTKCDFTFKIAEQLMRYVNATYLENILGELATKIQKINDELPGLKSEESSYEGVS